MTRIGRIFSWTRTSPARTTGILLTGMFAGPCRGRLTSAWIALLRQRVRFHFRPEFFVWDAFALPYLLAGHIEYFPKPDRMSQN